MASAEASLIIGVGNDYRGDDGAGLVVVRALRALELPCLRIVEHSGEAAALMDTWRDARHVFVIDAAHAGAKPGAIFRIEAHATPIPSPLLSRSTHDLGVAAAIEIARLMECLPGYLVVYAIEGRDFAVGSRPSAPIERACREVVARVAEEARRIADPSTCSTPTSA